MLTSSMTGPREVEAEAEEEEEEMVGDRIWRKASLHFLYKGVRFLVAMDEEEEEEDSRERSLLYGSREGERGFKESLVRLQSFVSCGSEKKRVGPSQTQS